MEVSRELDIDHSSHGWYAQVQESLETWMGGRLGECQSRAEESLVIDLYSAGYYSARPVPQAAKAVRIGLNVKRVPFTPLEYWDTKPLGKLPHIITNAHVIGIKENKSRGVILEVDTGDSTACKVSADNAILATGTFENTRLVAGLLMHQKGIDKLTLTNLTDHIVQGFVAVVPRKTVNLNFEERVFCCIPSYNTLRSNLFVEMVPHSSDDALLIRAWAMGEQNPPGSSVEVTAEGSGQKSMIVNVSISDADIGIVRRQVAALERLAAALLPDSPPKLQLHAEDFIAGRPSYAAALSQAMSIPGPIRKVSIFPYVYPLGGVDHESGTIALGDVVDIDGALPQLPRLSVLGPCVFPRAGAANPSFTTLALAKRHAARLARRI
jgi:hypothetical protein